MTGQDGEGGTCKPIGRTQAEDKGTEVTAQKKLMPPTHNGKPRGRITKVWQM